MRQKYHLGKGASETHRKIECIDFSGSKKPPWLSDVSLWHIYDVASVREKAAYCSHRGNIYQIFCSNTINYCNPWFVL